MTTTSNTYDVANWKPLTPEGFVDALGHLHYCREDFTVQFASEQLPDGRVRLVASALAEPSPEQKEEGATSELEPYLMLIWRPEGGKPLCMTRTDVTLDDQR